MKSYTDIEQSKVLAEILPIESADMCWELDKNCRIEAYNLVPLIRYSTKERKELFEKGKELIPCWSLAALLNVLPSSTLDSSDDHHYRAHCRERFTEWHDNAVDACHEMILKLHELNLL